MVFGNLSTGYWLGAAAAAGLHWVELGRTTLTGTSDTIGVNGHGWTTPDSSFINIANNVLNWENGGNMTTKFAHKSITALSDTQWTMRFKITIDQYASPSGDAHQLYINLQENAVNAEGDSKGVGFGIRKGTGTNGYRIMNQNSTSEIAAGTMTAFSRTATTETIYIELARTTSTNLRGRIYTQSDYSDTPETINATIASTLNGLDNIVVSVQQDNGTGGGLNGIIDDLKIWNATNTTTGTPDVNITFSGLTAKPYMMVLHHGIASGNIASRLRFNGDTGSNYAQRGSRNGASDSTGTSRDNVSFSLNPGNASDEFLTAMVNNTADQEKTWVSHGIDGTTGAGNDQNHSEIVGKWANTSDSITSVNVYHTESGDYASGSECVVLGCDPDDTEGTNIWEELGSGSSDGSSQTFTTGTFTAKKYLWFQAFNIGGGTSADVWLRVNDDTGANYVRTFTSNGGSNDVAINQSNGVSNVVISGTSGQAFCNGLIINKSDEEKFMFVDQIVNSNTGAGNAPNLRYESFNKWTNTSSQINKISIVSQTGNFSSGCYIKVWGFD